MATKLTPLGIVTKWLLAPIAIGCLGFYLIGPRVGEVAAEVSTVPGLKSAVERVKELARKAKGVDTNAPDQDAGVVKSNVRGQAFKEMRERANATKTPVSKEPVDPDSTIE